MIDLSGNTISSLHGLEDHPYLNEIDMEDNKASSLSCVDLRSSIYTSVYTCMHVHVKARVTVREGEGGRGDGIKRRGEGRERGEGRGGEGGKGEKGGEGKKGKGSGGKGEGKGWEEEGEGDRERR